MVYGSVLLFGSPRHWGVKPSNLGFDKPEGEAL